jgi:hypothetical protein
VPNNASAKVRALAPAERDFQGLKALHSLAVFGTSEEAAEKVEKQIPRRPKGLLGMTKIKSLSARPRSCNDAKPSIAEFFSSL